MQTCTSVSFQPREQKLVLEHTLCKKSMAMGRGSCMKVAVLALLIFWSPADTFAATYMVGDSQGWGFSVSYADWANGKSFAAGDTLVFNYQSGLHNVARVNAAKYKGCQAPADPSKLASTGNDKFTLKRGANYFICSMPGYCSSGMKIQVNAN